MALGRGPDDLICSSRGCEQPASFAIVWSNPALPFGRRKTWLTCTSHRDELKRYLDYRKFPLETMPLEVFLADKRDGDAKSTGVATGA